MEGVGFELLRLVYLEVPSFSFCPTHLSFLVDEVLGHFLEVLLNEDDVSVSKIIYILDISIEFVHFMFRFFEIC